MGQRKGVGMVEVGMGRSAGDPHGRQDTAPGQLARTMGRWQVGWGLARHFPPATLVAGGLVVMVGERGREVEYVVLYPSAQRPLAQLAASTPGAWFTAVTLDREATEGVVSAAGLTLAPTEWLMRRDLADYPEAQLPDGYQSEVRTEGQVVTARIFTDDGLLAASGRMAVPGTDAVADKIMTVPEHRRRGLGSVVMSELVAAARRRGAVTGLLIASAAGRKLYEAAGWDTVADVVIAQRAASEAR